MSKSSIKKIDDLGRIVIPKDIRKSLSIKTNDSLEIGVNGNLIQIEKNVSIKNFNVEVIKLANIFSKCGVYMLVSNRDNVIFNNTDININVSELIDLSLIELIDKSKDICSNCDIRPIIIDSNVEGIVIVTKSNCNNLVGELFNSIITNILDITC